MILLGVTNLGCSLWHYKELVSCITFEKMTKVKKLYDGFFLSIFVGLTLVQ